ncbi:xylulokinase [Aliiroseovarius halocynthiae]|uniref:Xylulose kinase n=1 Tax=Aliiroseovarius halocynthiae TaxID=985055 RepID=A0A545SNA2_9RHOB|nr:xylulokinase [Aliiroseovarius halocynthiae]TQV66449.1 xylulokinase [Aliiroseovarius halocynthiae]SMR83599.1 xylulokinase [Aliiroseovarius halocynthiae]
MAFLGIDLGTSGLRALLVDAEGCPIGSAERAYATHHPHPGWSEQNPKDWIDALTSAARELRVAHPEFADLKGLGVSGHMHGAVLVDESGDPIRPCIMWNDTRSHEEAARLDAIPEMRAISGNVAFPGFTAPKLEWVRAHEPENHARVSKVLLPAAYVNWYLTGDYVSDVSDCSGTGWLDLRARRWSATLLDAGNMRSDQMPRLVEGCTPAGQLKTELLSEWRINHPVIVAGGAGDNAAAACGIGALSEGQGFVSLGTSGVLLLARDGCDPAPETALHSFCHAIPGRWYQMGVMLSATNSLNWLSRISGQSPAALTKALGADIKPPSNELFLPYLSGERTPHNDAQIRAAFLGLDTQTSLDDMTRAVLEGVAFALRDSAEAMKATGAEIKVLYAVGGGAASRYWVELIATILGTCISLPKGGEFGAALGAARLAIVAATDARPEDVMRSPDYCDRITPRADLLSAYDDAYERFKDAYPAIRSVQ